MDQSIFLFQPVHFGPVGYESGPVQNGPIGFFFLATLWYFFGLFLKPDPVFWMDTLWHFNIK